MEFWFNFRMVAGQTHPEKISCMSKVSQPQFQYKGWLLNLEKQCVMFFSNMVALALVSEQSWLRARRAHWSGENGGSESSLSDSGDAQDAAINRLTATIYFSILRVAHGTMQSPLADPEAETRPVRECDVFINVSKDVLGSLLGDDVLVSESEEQVLKGIVRWTKRGPGRVIAGDSNFKSQGRANSEYSIRIFFWEWYILDRNYWD